MFFEKLHFTQYIYRQHTIVKTWEIDRLASSFNYTLMRGTLKL